MDTKKTISIILICIGIFILLFALSVDIIGIGKSTRFGYKQILGIIVGAITPLISSLVTGMPPLSPPIAQIMVFECAFLTGITGYLYVKRNIPVLISLALGFLASRFILLLWIQILVPLLGLPKKIFSIAYVAKGIPGVIMILIIVPFFVYRIKSRTNPKRPHIYEG